MKDFLNRLNAETAATFVASHMDRYRFVGKNEHPYIMQTQKDLYKTIITIYRETGIFQFLVGLRPGFDMWVAEMILDIMKENEKVELYCVVPFANQANKWSKKNQIRYAQILEQSTGVLQLDTGAYNQSCYVALDTFLVNHAHTLIAVSGKESKPKHHSKKMIHIARENGNRIIFVLHHGLCEPQARTSFYGQP